MNWMSKDWWGEEEERDGESSENEKREKEMTLERLRERKVKQKRGSKTVIVVERKLERGGKKELEMEK